MNFLIDTNVISEWVKKRPNPGVVSWLAQADEDRLFVSVITLAELRRGIHQMPGGRRRSRLDEWLRYELMPRFDGRFLSIDTTVADAWGRIVAQSEATGRRISVMDGFIAATAEVNALTLVTRNESDFTACVKSLVNPWSGS